MKRKVFFICFVLLAMGVLAQKKATSAQKTGQKKPAGHTSSSKANTSVSKGQAVYMKTCVSCHQKDGGGVQNMNPPLIKTSFVSGDKQRLIGIVLNGLSRQEIDGDTFTNVMPPFKTLSDEDIANVLTYVRKSFGNKYSAVAPADVKTVRSKQ